MQQTIRYGATPLFDALWAAVSNPSDTIQYKLIHLIDEAGSPLVDPTPADRDAGGRRSSFSSPGRGDPYAGRGWGSRAPAHQGLRELQVRRTLESLLISPDYERYMGYDGPVSLLADAR